MRPSFLVIVLSVLTLGLGSCGLIGGGGEDPATEAPPEEPVASAPQTTPTEGETEAEAEEAPPEVFPEEEAEAEEPPPPPPPQSALQQSTNPEQRAQSAGQTTGQKDPFNPPGIIITGGSANGGAENGGPAGGIPPIAVETPPPPEPPDTAGGGNGGGGVAPGIPSIAPLSIPELPQVEPPPNLGVDPRFQPVVAEAPFNPGPPPPNTARAVEVSAVVQVGQVVKAIVKSPGEETRYVGVGEYIGGGSVYVKNIDVYTPAEPVVILEEFGQEVARAVGAAPLPPETPPQPAGGPVETTVRGVRLGDVKLTEISGGFLISGTLQNIGEEDLEVTSLTLQLQEKGTGTIVNDFNISVTANLKPDQKREFRVTRRGSDVKAVVFGGRDASQLVAILLEWE